MVLRQPHICGLNFDPNFSPTDTSSGTTFSTYTPALWNTRGRGSNLGDDPSCLLHILRFFVRERANERRPQPNGDPASNVTPSCLFIGEELVSGETRLRPQVLPLGG